MRGVRVHELETTDAFVVFDLQEAPLSVGIVRLAPKILRDGATMLARSTSYAFAFFGLRIGGASAGVNAKPEERDPALTAFMEEMVPMVAERRLVLYPGTGVSDADLRPLGIDPPEAGLAARSAVAAAEGTLGSLSGARVAVAADGPAADTVRTLLSQRGATLDGSALDAAADVLFVAGKSGVVDHDAATTVRAKCLVPLTPLPVTAKAYAALCRAEVVYVPDFVALAAPLLGTFDRQAVAAPDARVREAAAALRDEGVGSWRAAVAQAETFLGTWQPSLPFGRPLA
jgi:glutamate dehydrogenase/leucine dehydrogenase